METNFYPNRPDGIIPLQTAHAPPSFPVECLPPVIGNYVDFISKSVQVYPDMPTTVALSVLSLCLQGKTRIRLNSIWSEEVNLYIMVAAPPAERKSPVFKAFMSPVSDYVSQYNAEHRIDFQTYRSEKKKLDYKLNKAIESCKEETEIRNIQLEINDLKPVTEKKLITTDTTAEALAVIMKDNNEVMGIMSDEGGVFDVISGIYSGNSVNINIFLQGYDGMPIDIDRKSGSVSLRRPLLTFGICAQPEVIGNIIGNKQFAGRGLIQRFLYCLPESTLGQREKIPDINGDKETREYRELIFKLLNMPIDSSRITELSCDAYELIEDYTVKVEKQMSGMEILSDYREYFGKHIGKAIRIAGLLHLCEHSPSECISGQTMGNAIKIATYYGQHYLKMVCADTYDTTPHILFEKILARARREKTPEMSLRTIKRSVRSMTEEQLQNALDTLVEHNYLTYIPVQPGSGNRRKESYAINSILLNGG